MTRYTSKDAARLAGVSLSTVSYVLSGKRPISEATRQRVLAAIEELTYQPNASARALASNRSSIIGLVLPFGAVTDTSALMPFVQTITADARAREYDVLLVGSDEGSSGLKRLAKQALCDAIIVMNVETQDARVAVARELPVPVVFIGLPADHVGLSCVDVDYGAAGRIAVEEIADTGHDRLVIVEYPQEMMQRRLSFVDRLLDSAQNAARSRGIVCEVITPPVGRRAGARAAADRILAAPSGRTAVLIANTELIQPVMDELARRGVAPGKQLPVIGLCTDAEAAECDPQVTNISLDPRTVSTRAMGHVFELLGDRGDLLEPRVDLVEPRMTHRESTMPRQ